MLAILEQSHPPPSWRSQKRRRLGGEIPGALLSLICLVFGINNPSRAVASPTEYQVKAAFLYNFAKHIEWPSNRLSAADSPIILGVLGPDPFGADLDQIVANRTVKRHPVIVKRVTRIADARDCHILYLGKMDSVRARDALAQLHGSGTLTVSDMERFLEWGGAIQFVIHNKKIRFEADRRVLRGQQLQVSAQLLSVAAAVHENTMESK